MSSLSTTTIVSVSRATGAKPAVSSGARDSASLSNAAGATTVYSLGVDLVGVAGASMIALLKKDHRGAI